MILDFDSAKASSLRGVTRNDDMDSARSLAASSLIPSSPFRASAEIASFSSLRSLSLFFFLALCPFLLPEPRDEGEASDLLLRFDGAGLDGGWSDLTCGIFLPKSFHKIQKLSFTAPSQCPRKQALYNTTPSPTQNLFPRKGERLT